MIQDGPMLEPSGGGSKQYQFPAFSKPTAIEFSMMMPQLLKDIDSLTAPQIIAKIREAMQQANKAEEHDYEALARRTRGVEDHEQ